MNHPLHEEKESLWYLVASPSIWALHFLASYSTAAIWCAKRAGPDGSLATVRITIALYSVLALAAIALIGRRGFARSRHGGAALPHDTDSHEDRHRFLGFATLLLSGLSGVAVIYAALVAVFVRTC